MFTFNNDKRIRGWQEWMAEMDGEKSNIIFAVEN